MVPSPRRKTYKTKRPMPRRPLYFCAKPLMPLPQNIKSGKITPLAQCMHDQYKNEDPIKAYPDYCIHEKHYAKWEKGRDKPNWWTKEIAA